MDTLKHKDLATAEPGLVSIEAQTDREGKEQTEGMLVCGLRSWKRCNQPVSLDVRTSVRSRSFRSLAAQY